MKKIMLLACGLLIALSQAKLSAQTQMEDSSPESGRVHTDTLFIKLQGGNKAMITGAQFRYLKKYMQADSLKSLFLNDYDRAVKDQTLSADASIIHYFVHPSGKRRLKAEMAEYSESKVNIDAEIKRLDLDLPKYQYYIHDLSTGYTIEVFMNDPTKLKEVLSPISLNEAIAEGTKDKDLYKHNVKIELTHDNGSFKVTGKNDKGVDILMVNPSLGVGIIGNVVAPVIGADISIVLNDKYSEGKYKLGIGLTAFPLADISSREVKSVGIVKSYDANFMVNLNMGQSRKEHWFGLNAGIMRSDIGSFNNAFKVGMVFESKVNYSFDLIYDRNNNTIPSLTVKLPF